MCTSVRGRDVNTFSPMEGMYMTSLGVKLGPEDDNHKAAWWIQVNAEGYRLCVCGNFIFLSYFRNDCGVFDVRYILFTAMNSYNEDLKYLRNYCIENLLQILFNVAVEFYAYRVVFNLL